MCPDRKTEWFKENGFTKDEIHHLKTSVIAHWVQKYAPDLTSREGVDTQQKVKVRSQQFHYDYI